MKKSFKKAVSLTLLVLICVPMLLLLCACEPEYYENGVCAKIYNKNTPNGYARVCEVDSNDANVCVIPAYITYKGLTYPVREIGPYGAFLFNKGYSTLCRDLEELVIPETVTFFDIDSYLSIWSDQFDTLKRITVSSDNTVYSSEDGVLYSDGGRELLFYPPAKEGEVMHIGKDVTSINFAECNFRNRNIRTVEVAEGNRYFKAVDGVLCSHDGKTLLYVPIMDYYFNGYFTIPDGIEVISEYCFGFGHTNIKHVFIPQSVKTMEYTIAENGYISHAFARSIRNLYFESETAPDYLANLKLSEYYRLHFGVTREEFQALDEASRLG